MPPDCSVPRNAIKVTNTKKPTNDAAVAKACVPPPFPESDASVAGPPVTLGPPFLAEPNTVTAHTVANTMAPIAANTTVRRCRRR